VILRAIELSKRSAGNLNGAISFQPLESTIIILGYGAILLNLVFILIALTIFLFKKPNTMPRWIVWFNVILLPFQVYFHFFYQ